MAGEEIQKFTVKAVNKNTKLLKDVAKRLDMKRLLLMQTPVFVFRSVTK